VRFGHELLSKIIRSALILLSTLDPTSLAYGIVPVCIFAFIAAHAIGQGTVIWVLISEIFPNRNRAAGQSLGSCVRAR